MIYKVCPGYIDVRQTVLVLLTMAGLFPDRPHMTLELMPADDEGVDHTNPWGKRSQAEVAANE